MSLQFSGYNYNNNNARVVLCCVPKPFASFHQSFLKMPRCRTFPVGPSETVSSLTQGPSHK